MAAAVPTLSATHGQQHKIFGDKKLKRKLTQSIEAVKKKVRALQSDKQLLTTRLEETFEPITKPLKALSSDLKIKSEPSDTLLQQTPEKKSSSTPYSSSKFKRGNIKKELESDDYEEDYSDDDDDEHYDDDVATHPYIFTASPSKKNDTVEDAHVPVASSSNKNYTVEGDESENLDESVTLKYYAQLFKHEKIPFGAYMQRNKIYVGDSPLKINNNEITIKGNKFIKTHGLMELLFKKVPKKEIVQKTDVENYLNILTLTNAYRRGYSPQGQVQGSRSIKYNAYIRRYLSALPKTSTTTKQGGSLHQPAAPKNNLFTQKSYYPNTDYIYWDDPNELVDRLRLLIASQNAGNTSHTNEINAIKEELQEAGIILRN